MKEKIKQDKATKYNISNTATGDLEAAKNGIFNKNNDNNNNDKCKSTQKNKKNLTKTYLDHNERFKQKKAREEEELKIKRDNNKCLDNLSDSFRLSTYGSEDYEAEAEQYIRGEDKYLEAVEKDVLINEWLYGNDKKKYKLIINIFRMRLRYPEKYDAEITSRRLQGVLKGLL